MLFSTIFLGWLGVIIFIVILFMFQKLMKSNEYAFLHLLMAIMYALWLPLPFVFYQLLDSEILIVGTVFGIAYLILLIAGMVLQTGHLIFITKYNENRTITESQGNYIMSTLSHPLEGLSNVFKCIWAIFLSITFWQSGQLLMATVMLVFGLFFIYYLLIILDASLIKRLKLFEKVKPNLILINIETLLFFVTLLIYLTVI